MLDAFSQQGLPFAIQGGDMECFKPEQVTEPRMLE